MAKPIPEREPIGDAFTGVVAALDSGDLLVGEPAWEFITRRSNLHPRAEVFGYRSDGRDEMMVVKNLDLALSAEVLVYADLPPRLLHYLPRYDTLAAWRLKEQP